MVNQWRKNRGPLTPFQIKLMDHLSAGGTQEAAAKQHGCSTGHVCAETGLARQKLRAATTAHACTLWSVRRAYLEAADLLDQSSRAHPQKDGVAEDHVNHVLTALAETLRERAAALLPK